MIHDSGLDDDFTLPKVGGRLGREALYDVRAMVGEQDDVVAKGLFGVDDGVEHGVVDDRQFGRVGRVRPGVGHDGEHRLTDVAHNVARDERASHGVDERRIVVRRQPERAEVMASEDRYHSRGRTGLGRVDGDDARVGVR